MAESRAEHGPKDAWYDNLGFLAYGHVMPRMECLCGFVTRRGHQVWMTVGEEFDEHIESAAKREAGDV